MNEGDIPEYAKILLRNEDLDSRIKEVEKENEMASEVLDLHLVKTWKLYDNLHSLAEDNLDDDDDEKGFEYNSEKFKCISGKDYRSITIYSREKRNKSMIAKIEVRGGSGGDEHSVYSKTISIDKLDLLTEFSEELILEVNRAIVKKSKDTEQIEKTNSKFVRIFGAIKNE